METIISLIQLTQKVVFSIGPFVLLLGALIFIHELGHFLMARYFGVRVEVFSLGFGPKILKYKRGDTLYCLSLFPLGGYVKMFGDNPLEKVPDFEKSKGFLYKKVPEKWLIAFAGPLMNLIFTLGAFFLLAFFGLKTLPSQLGDIKMKSKAYLAGFRSGDKVLSVNGQAVSYYEDWGGLIKNKVGEPLLFQVQTETNKIKTIKTASVKTKNPNPLEWKKHIGSIEGLSLASMGLRIGVIPSSSAYKAGLRTFDEIVQVEGRTLKYWRELEGFVKKMNTPLSSIVVKRGSETLTIRLNQKFVSLSELGIEPSYLYIERVGPGTPADLAGLKREDRLISINEEPIQSWERVLDIIKFSEGSPLRIKYQRGDEIKTVSLAPKPLFIEGNIKKRFMLGIAGGGMEIFPEEVLRKRNVLESLFYSGQQTWSWLGRIVTGLFRLIQGEISLRTMGGPIMIGRVAHSSFQQGLSSFLFMMALISLNLFFLNLLPIPMLDGGHLLFFTLEGILGRPLSIKKLLIAQQVGLALLLFFMGFTVFNDIYTWLKAW